MEQILEGLVTKINAATIDSLPSDNIFMEEVFPADMYQEILARLPRDEQYHFIEHPDAILPNGTKTRKLLDLSEGTIQQLDVHAQPFWREFTKILRSDVLQQAIMRKFSQRITERFGEIWPEMVTVPILYRDFPGYRIGIHTDAPYKLATLQFYFPNDLSQIHLGTSFHLRLQHNNQFMLLKTNPFKPNAAYAFARTDESWHSVNQLAASESTRDSLALTIYLKGHEYSSEISKSKSDY